jgi:hypothetical protein
MTFLLILLSLLLSIAGYLGYFITRRRRLILQGWDDVLASIRPVNIEGLRLVANHYLQPDKDQLSVEPEKMWEIVGGLTGIQTLKSNAKVMQNLAIYAERWNWDQGPVVSELIRRDAARLNKAVFRIQLAYFFQRGFIRAPFDIQEAVASYHLIRTRLFGLYQVTHIALVPSLEAAL